MSQIAEKKEDLETEDSLPKIPGGEKFSIILRQNTASHLRKREEQLLESRRYKEEPENARNFCGQVN